MIGKGGSKNFFFEKKKQKTLLLAGSVHAFLHRARGGTGSKSFLVLFFKKELLKTYTAQRAI